MVATSQPTNALQTIHNTHKHPSAANVRHKHYIYNISSGQNLCDGLCVCTTNFKQTNKQKLTFELVGRIRCPMSMFHIQIVTRIKHTFCCGGQINVRDSQWISRHTQLTQPKNETSNHLINLTKYMAICTAVSDAATATVSADISYCTYSFCVSHSKCSSFIFLHFVLSEPSGSHCGWDGMRCIFSFECKIQSIKVENFNSIWFNRIKWHQFTLLFTVCVCVLWHGEWITESRARDHLGCLTHNRHMLTICVCCVSMSVTGGRRQTNPTAKPKEKRMNESAYRV